MSAAVAVVGIQLDIHRMRAIAEALREQIPNVSPQASRSMIDAAGELQRLADQVEEMSKRNAEIVKSVMDQLAAQQCQCPACTERRAAASKPSPGSLN